MIGAARFELDLALLDASFLNPEFGKGRLHTGNCQPRRRDENRQRYLSLVVSQERPPIRSPTDPLQMIRGEGIAKVLLVSSAWAPGPKRGPSDLTDGSDAGDRRNVTSEFPATQGQRAKLAAAVPRHINNCKLSKMPEFRLLN